MNLKAVAKKLLVSSIIHTVNIVDRLSGASKAVRTKPTVEDLEESRV